VVRELLARIRALLRRRGSLVPTVMRVGDLELDSLRHRVARRGQRIELTNREYALLEYLLRNAGRVVSRTMLAEHVWEQSFDPRSNVIDVHVARLRRKIDGGFETKLVHTMRGSGYVLQAPEAEEPVSLSAPSEARAKKAPRRAPSGRTRRSRAASSR
jgi:DNA-binding response OmpR family regulator